uniref:Putative sequestosome 1 n=1 Tax=Amblyomma triste TaxID=251400 RepID=A0A023GPA0_AMBTT
MCPFCLTFMIRCSTSHGIRWMIVIACAYVLQVRLTDPMTVTIKAYLRDPFGSVTEIRRFVIEDLRDYRRLYERIRMAFSLTMEFILSWTDPEGDEIVMSSDAELAQAVQNMKDGVLKIFVVLVSPAGANSDERKPAPAAGASATEDSTRVHAGVLCDACDQEIRGVRYKCLQCEDYDLCDSCHGKKIHDEHDMLKLVNPGVRPLWAFPGWKRLWRHCGYHRRGGHRGTERGCPAQGHPRSPPHPRPDQRQQYQEILRGIGDTVANFLEPFGITVDVLNDMASNTAPPEQPKRDCATEPMDTASQDQASSSSAEHVPPVAKPQKPMDVQGAAASSSVPAAPIGGPFQAAEAGSGGNTTQGDGARNSDVVVDSDGAPSGWTLLNPLRDSVMEETTLPPPISPQVVPAVPLLPAAPKADSPVDIALTQMLAMGFNNEGGWLRQLLEVKHADIGAVLESLHPSPK